MIYKHESNVHVAAAKSVHNRVAEKIGLERARHKPIIALQDSAAHVLFNEFSALLAVVVAILVLWIVLDDTFDGHEHIGRNCVSLVGLVYHVWDELIATLDPRRYSFVVKFKHR